ncbi:LuxR C-terminal-related transcriptional regulator [Streptomyces sp. NPDC092296]|uniref:helix-turn-helix transcriptional regulator n=1 Tax=Streptomyces sp. NPDC092296 TaxID=3366012 RepID=UPI00381106AA
MGLNDLSQLGVSPDEERVYRAVLRAPGLGLNALALTCGLDQECLGDVVTRLQSRGMVKSDQQQRISGTDPVVVVERLVEARLSELQKELQQVISSRHLATTLLEDQREGQRNAVPGDVERIEGLEQVRSRIDELTFFTHHELLAVQPKGALSAAAIEATREADLRCLRRGIEMRTVIRADALQDGPTADYLGELAAKGVLIRAADGPLERMLIFDRRTALVPIDPQDSARGALVVHQAGMLASLLALFERFWSGAASLDQERLSDIEQQVLRIMARVDKDEAGARELNISVRTYRGHVAELMRRLGATSRVQGALAARDRGWI